MVPLNGVLPKTIARSGLPARIGGACVPQAACARSPTGPGPSIESANFLGNHTWAVFKSFSETRPLIDDQEVTV